MNTTPKQQDGEGITAANAARSSLEQTVMGVSPPSSAVAPASSVQAVPALAEGLAPVLPGPEPADARSADGHGPAIVAAPTISVAPAPAPAGTQPAVAGSAALHEPAQRSAEPEGAVADAVQLAPSPAVPRITPPGSRANESGQTDDPLQHTALSADYLRAARDAALGPAHDAAPDPLANDVATHAPLAVPGHDRAGDTQSAPWMERASSEAPPSHSGTRPSMAPPFPEPAPVAAKRTPASGSRGFEPVPVLRAPLAESLSGAFGPIAELGSPRHLPPTPRLHPAPTRRRDAAGRWMLLGSVALATVGVVTFGTRVWDRYRRTAERTGTATAPDVAASSTPGSTKEAPLAGSAPPSRALMANRPAPEPAGDGRVRVISATGAPVTRASGDEVPAAGASPESQLAATAGRHVLTGNYAEALPLYRHLERSWPETTAYAVMARLLEKKVGAANDTRTITPAAPSP